MPPLDTTTHMLDELSRGAKISIVELVDSMIEKAELTHASDIHIDPTLKEVRVRMRIDGVLKDMYSLPKNIYLEVIARIKVLSKLRTDEHQTTQDGRFRYHKKSNEEYTDIRVSIIPTYHGENAVLRLLTDKGNSFTLENLGFSTEDQKKILRALKKPNGMILSTGPTGSGKTTTLYTLIKMLSSPEVSIVTIEDPIEYAMSDIKQIQVNPKTGLTFANGLRSILRQDPNIIMVGEIRDSETARIAVNTALTGHLLLSTLHTNDAATTLPRLLDMGIEEYLVASTVSIAIGQRLVRKICNHCKEKTEISRAMRESMPEHMTTFLNETTTFYKGAGCSTCNNSGYSGRICINEVLVSDEAIKKAILTKTSSSDIQKIAVASGMTTMFEDGLKKVKNGDTTLEEVFRVIHE
ncbi:MAG: GspE/PulE family protein [Candidatus Zambryskibacteria bacterium]|nr:GspE/PulE family protein [Candidatus Zambryskibacteria bacterium]